MNPRRWTYFILFVIAFILACIGLLSCETLKTFKSEKATDAAVHGDKAAVSDSGKGGATRLETNLFKELYENLKTTVNLAKDTGKNGEVNVYPTSYIYESAKGSKESESKTFDSSWFLKALKAERSRYDSIYSVRQTEESLKHTESKGWPLWVWALIAFVGYELLKFGLPKFVKLDFKNPFKKL